MAPHTFIYMPVGGPATKTHLRGKYAIEVLKLNTREYLRTAREIAYDTFKSYVGYYVSERRKEVSTAELDTIVGRMLRKPHLGVWRQMQRHYQLYPDLMALFADEPAALQW